MTIVEELRQNRESGARRLEAEYKAGLMTLARRFYVRCLGSLPPEKAGVTGAQIRNRLQQLQ